MSKTGFKSSNSKTQYNYKVKNSSITQSSSQQQTNFKDYEIDSDFFDDFNPEHSGNIIQQKTERSFDNQGNRIIKTKIVKEIDEPISKRNQVTKISKQAKNESIRFSKNSNFKNESDKQRTLYSSPDFKSISPSVSPILKNDRRDSKNIEEIGYKTNYMYESKKVNGKNIGTYSTNEKYEYINRKGKRETRYEKSSMGSPDVTGTEVISPVGYIENNSSGSEFEENQIKSLDNCQYSTITNKTNKSNFTKYNKNAKNLKNYELEDPEGFDYLSKNQRKVSNDELKKTGYYHNRSQIRNKINDLSKSDIKDFQSPDRDVNDTKKFRKVNIGMLYSKGPSNDDNKVTNIMTKEVIQTSTDYKKGTKYISKKVISNNYSEDQNVRITAAKIIQAWWRKKFNREEEEVYDITVKSAVKLQSFIRGFLVRKKVLRYITLAIYYQSFCDKLQDVLCNNVKNEIFKLFKKKYLSKDKKTIKKVSKEILIKRQELLTNIIEIIIEKKILFILKKWKETAFKIKQRKTTYNKEANKKMVTKKSVKNNSITTRKKQNVTSSQKMQIKQVKQVKVKKVQNITESTTSTKSRQIETKSQGITKAKSIERFNKVPEIPKTPRIPTVRFEFKGVSSPYKYSTNIKEVENKVHYYPDSYNKFYNYNYTNEYDYDYNINKSYDNIYYQKEKELIKYTNVSKDRTNHKCFNRVEKSKEKEIERNLSPQFGSLKTNKDIKQTTKYTYEDKRKNKLQDNKITSKTINTSANYRRTNKQTKNMTKKTTTTTNITRKNKEIGKTQVIIPRKQINYSESENIYKQKRTERRTLRNDRYKISDFDNVPCNSIDNQLSISIVKLPEEDNLNKTAINENTAEASKIKIKEKIIIQKEMQPETAEEGNNFQIFDMQVSKRVSLFIKPTYELKQKITDEQKELEIVKKIEREKNQEIDKYKKDIEMHIEKTKLDALKYAIKTIEAFKKNILRKKFEQYKKKVFKKNVILKIESHDDLQINRVAKETKDIQVQMTSSPQNSPQKTKEGKSFKQLKISSVKPISYVFKKTEKPQKITNTSKFNILSKVKKVSQGQQSESWNKQVIRMSDNRINIIKQMPKTCEIGCDAKALEIENKPKMVDDGIQHEYEENYIEAESIEIIGAKPEYKDSTCQYEQYNPKISKEKFSIIQKKPEKKVWTCDAQCNTVIRTEEKGVNAVEQIQPKPKNIEVKIRTVKRSLAKMEVPILKKLWLRKAFKTFRENCQRPPFHLILQRELLRMALLRWRFIRGYGPDRYGNVYDRDGNLLYKTKGKVADFQIQNETKIEQSDEGTQYIPIENIISTLKQIQIAPSYGKPVKKMTKDVGVGNNVRLEERIEKNESINIRQRPKKTPKNYITKDNFNIIKKPKKLVDQETQMSKVDNKIQKLEKISLTNDDYILRQKNNAKLKELLTKMIYRKIITDKLNLSEALRNWLKQTMILVHNEEIENENLRRRQTAIKKSDRFSLIEKISKQDAGTQMMVKKNQVENTLNINLINKVPKKNAEISVDLPPQFNLDKIKPRKENKIEFESTKKPVVLKTHKEFDMNIYSEDYIFNEEVKRGIHHPMTETAKKRVTEILYKFFNSRGSPSSLLKKYFSIWSRKTNYLTLMRNAKIITDFCRHNLRNVMAQKRWKKFSKKLLLKEKIKIVKMSKEATTRISKIFDLIRITRINTVFSKKRFLHFIIIAWLAYTRTINQKRSHVQSLYENMLNTYMNLADDVFGSNQKENPSVQDALFEAVDSNKFQTQHLQDVPLAKEYYENKKEYTKINANISYNCDDKSTSKDKDNDADKEVETKEYTVYKTIKTTHPISTSVNTNRNKEKENFKEKIEVRNEERLHSKGRGRAFRTQQEKEIIKKYNENIAYGLSRSRDKEKNKDLEKEEPIIEEEIKEIKEVKKVKEVKEEKGLGGERHFKNRIIIRSVRTEDIQSDNDDNDENSGRNDNKNLSYRERRQFQIKSYDQNKK